MLILVWPLTVTLIVAFLITWGFIPGEYVVGLLAQIFLNKEKGATIIHDPRVIWNTVDIVDECGGHAVASKTGHAFVKAAMRTGDASMAAKYQPSLLQGLCLLRQWNHSMAPGLGVSLLVKLLLSGLILREKSLDGELNFTVPNAANAQKGLGAALHQAQCWSRWPVDVL